MASRLAEGERCVKCDQLSPLPYNPQTGLINIRSRSGKVRQGQGQVKVKVKVRQGQGQGKVPPGKEGTDSFYDLVGLAR